MRLSSRRRALFALALATVPSLGWVQTTNPAPTISAAGSYTLGGIREVVGELRLGPDQRFSLAMAYGGADEHAEGTWRQVGRQIELSVPPASAPAFAAPRWSTAVPDPYSAPGERPVLLAVRVASSPLGMLWANVDVAAEFSNGQTRRGRTGRDGRLAFDERTEPPWAGARVRRLGIGYEKHGVPMTWFDVPPDARAADVEMAPGQLAASSFRTMRLSAGVRDGRVGELVVQDIDGNAPSRRMVFGR